MKPILILLSLISFIGCSHVHRNTCSFEYEVECSQLELCGNSSYISFSIDKDKCFCVDYTTCNEIDWWTK